MFKLFGFEYGGSSFEIFGSSWSGLECLVVDGQEIARKRNFRHSSCYEFTTTALGRVPAQAPCGSPIPFGNFVATPGNGSTLLAGDAAGLVEPLTGEGIAFAVQSGAYAAQAIIEAARAKAPSRALAFYLPRYRSIVRSFRDVRLLRRLVFSRTTRALFLRALNGNRRMVLKHMDVLAGDADYRDYARYALTETLQRLPRLCVAALR